MHVLLEVVTWAVIATGTLAAALLALALTRRGPGLRQAKPGQRREWTLLFLSLSTVLLASSRLMHATAAWITLSLAGCLTCAAFSRELRSSLNSRSRRRQATQRST
jgi:hypothetical protein